MKAAMINWINDLITQPKFKSILWSMAISLLLVITLAALDIVSTLQTSTIAGALIYQVVYMIKLPADERNTALRKIGEFIHVHRSIIFALAAWMTVIYLVPVQHREIEDKVVLGVHETIRFFGLTLVILVPMYHFMFNAISGNHPGYYLKLITKITAGLGAYCIVLWGVATYGEVFKESVIANPEEAVGAFICILLLLVIARISATKFSTYEKGGIGLNNMPLAQSAEFEPELVLRSDDEEIIAAHEAGHTLVYAALGSIPPNVTTVIERNTKRGSLGSVTSVMNKGPLDRRLFLEWRMLVLLAGKVAEELSKNENTTGSINDHNQWLMSAKAYLSNHFDGIYYSEPANMFEHQHSHKMLEALQAQQTEELKSFFLTNKDVHLELARELLNKRKLDSKALIPFLQRVDVPDTFPFPLGEFTEFSDQWDENCGLGTYLD